MALKTPKFRMVKCPDCNGRGELFEYKSGYMTAVGCPKCLGKGKVKQ